MGQDPFSPQPGRQDSPYGSGQSYPQSGGSPGGAPGTPQPGYGPQSPQPAQPYQPGPTSVPPPQGPYSAPGTQSPFSAPGLQSPYSAPGPQSPYSAPGYTQPGAAPGYTPQGSPNPYAMPSQPGQMPTAPTQIQPPAAGPYATPPGFGPAAPYGAPGLPPSAPPPAKKGKGLLIGLIAGGAALLIVIALVIVFVVVKPGSNNNAGGDPASSKTAYAALKGYLEALAAGDATKAKEYALNPPADSALLSDDFLKAAVAKNPITNIEVADSGQYGESAYVTANYKLGNTTVQGNYQLTKTGGTWKLNDIVATDDRPDSWGDLDVKINDTTVPSDGVALFPGVYELSSGSSLIDMGDTATFTVKEPSTYVADLTSATPELSSAGKKAMISASQAWLKQCLNQPTLNPPNCSMENARLPNGVSLKAGTLKRTVTTSGTPFADSTPRVAYADPTNVTMSTYLSIKVQLVGSDGISYSTTTSVSTASGTISGDKITVVFTN